MGVLTPAEPALNVRARGHWPVYCAAALYAALSGVTVFFHEPWADEAHSWLLARDANLVEIWTGLMHYEGTPGLWPTLLHALIRLGLPYSGMNLVSALFGFAAAWMFARWAPFPLGIRLAMPFTFYLFFQYSVVARNYSLLPALLFACALLYPEGGRKLWLFTAVLCLVACTSVHGMLISGAIGLSFIVGEGLRKRLWIAGLVYAAAVLLIVWSAWPAKDVTFAIRKDYSFGGLLQVTGETLAGAFTGEWISSLAVIALCCSFLWRGRALLMFGAAALALCVFNSFVYSNVWHQGILFLAWLFAMWISAKRTKPTRMALAAMIAVIAIQGYWAFATTVYDWKNPYSGSREAARYLRDNGLIKTKLFGFGFACVGIQPYFSRNIFANFRDGEAQAYWDWSSANRNFEGYEDLAALHPEYVMAGYKDEEEQILRRNKIKKSGYDLFRHFEGNLFWHDEIFEPDAFDLYKRRTME